MVAPIYIMTNGATEYFFMPTPHIIIITIEVILLNCETIYKCSVYLIFICFSCIISEIEQFLLYLLTFRISSIVNYSFCHLFY